MKKKFIDYFMSIADITSKLSYAKRLQVGAVIVKGNQIIGTGYNGMPSGWENNCEYKELQIPYSLPDELIGKILRYSVDAEIIKPESLRQLWLSKIENMYKKYVKGN